MYTYVYMCINAHTYVHIHTYTYILTYIHTYILLSNNISNNNCSYTNIAKCFTVCFGHIDKPSFLFI